MADKVNKLELFNKTRKEFFEELLVTCHCEDLDEYTPFTKTQIKEYYNLVKTCENVFFTKYYLDDAIFYKTSFSLKNTEGLIDSFSYTSYLYLISTSMFDKKRLQKVSKNIKMSKEAKETNENNQQNQQNQQNNQLENISNEIMKSMPKDSETPSGLNDIISEVLKSVKQETGNRDLSKLNISPADILSSMTSKSSNDSLKNKTGIDFNSLISGISSKIEEKVLSGDISMDGLEGMVKK